MAVKLAEKFEEIDFPCKGVCPPNRLKQGKKVGEVAGVKLAKKKREETKGTPAWSWEITFY